MIFRHSPQLQIFIFLMIYLLEVTQVPISSKTNYIIQSCCIKIGHGKTYASVFFSKQYIFYKYKNMLHILLTCRLLTFLDDYFFTNLWYRISLPHSFITVQLYSLFVHWFSMYFNKMLSRCFNIVKYLHYRWNNCANVLKFQEELTTSHT